jgi:tRNA (guanine-N7-)-methyltransferase
MRIRTHTNPFNYFQRMKKINFSEVFPNFKGTLDLEIGFGRGIFIRKYAKQHPEKHIVGVEVRKNIVSILQERLIKEDINNVHLIHGNAQIFLEDSIEDNTLDNIFLFHPDPWIKKKHHKRRVITPKFLDVIAKKLTPNGKLQLSTDYTPLWESMMETISDHKKFIEAEDKNFWEEKYQSHWTDYSIEDNRSFHKGTFQLMAL